MNGLRGIANADLAHILGDTATGFGWTTVLTSPSGWSAPLVGFSNDISTAIDPDTGMLVSGRSASVAYHFAALRLAGFDTNPRGVMDAKSRPWVVVFNDIEGKPHKFKVFKSNPDRAAGMITLELEVYK